MRVTLLSLVVTGLLCGCQATREYYYNAWENFGGYAKRERLVDNVKAASKAQEAAKQQFASALDQFKSVVNFDGGELEKMHKKLNSEYEACESRAETVRSRIKSVKNVATALFGEWSGEIKQMSDPTLKSKSQDLMNQTRASYDQLVTRMDAAAASMDPVLRSFKDRVLFIKHNLNAQAIASLRGTEVELGREIESLIGEMERSIAEADKFIAEISKS